MGKFLFLFAFLIGLGLVGPAEKEALAQCTHLGALGTCPVGIPNGSNSISFNADGTINWSSGGVSGPCCAAPSGIETGTGLLNQNNALGGSRIGLVPPTTRIGPGSPGIRIGETVVILGQGLQDPAQAPSCNFNGCTGGGVLGEVFGANPNSGYLCDAGGTGCGNDLWVDLGLPEPGFGRCGPGGCTGPAPILPLPTVNIPGTGPYAANQTAGAIDPFGSAGNTFVDPLTGEPTELPENREDWPDKIKLADELNTAYVNGEIGYPFFDPSWSERSVQYYKDNPVAAPITPAGTSILTTSTPANFYQPSGVPEVPVLVLPTLPNTFNSPYRNNLTQGNIDPFGGAGNFFQDPRTGETTELPENQDEWPEKFKKADRLNSLYVSGHITYPFNDPNWETKPESDFAKTPGTGTASAPSEFTAGGGVFTTAPVPDDRISVYPVQPGDNLFRIALRFGVTVKDLQAANNLKDGDPVPVGQVLTIPTSTPAPVSVTTASDPAEGTQTPQPSNRGSKYSDKSGRFGIGADTTLGGVGGLSARFQVAKNFGVQAIVSFVRVSFDTKEQADLTDYVSTAVVATDPKNQPTQSPQTAPRDSSRSSNQPGFQSRVVSNYTGVGPEVIEVRERGKEPSYKVYVPSVGRHLTFKNRSDAFNFTNQLRYEGTSFQETLQNLPDDRRPIPDRAATTNPLDAIQESVPVEFQFPKLTDRWDGEIHDIYVTNPRTNQQEYFKTREHAEIFLDAIRGGATWAEAQKIDLEATRVARNNGVVATTPDGLASATVRGGGRTPTGPATGGEAPVQLNNRPAIIVSPETSGSQNNAGGTNASESDNAGSFSSITSRENNLVVTPRRPEGTSAGTMKGLLNGTAYDIEIIRTPDGRTLAVGTGENANHVFGEVKETSNKIFGDWRREGPWTPPPAKTQTADTPATTPTTGTGTPTPTPSSQAANNRIRSQIANSDREYMTRPVFADGFESGDTSAWTRTGQ